MSIRDAKLEDFAAVFSLLRQLWPDRTIDEDELHTVYTLSIENECEYAICYCREEKVVGFAAGNIQNAFYRTGNVCYVGVMIVDSDYRSQGIGNKLMDYIKTIAFQNNCKALRLESGFQRKKTHDFYENYGFEKTAYTFSYELKTTD